MVQPWRRPFNWSVLAVLVLFECASAQSPFAECSEAHTDKLLNGHTLRTTHDELNLVELNGVRKNELAGAFDEITVASGTSLELFDGHALEARGGASLTANIEGASSPLRLGDGSIGQFVVRGDGAASRIHLPSAVPAWSVSLKRGWCPSDRLHATPAVHLLRRASKSFRAIVSDDVVYVGTSYDCGGFSTQNGVKGLRARDGREVWRFNEFAQFPVDTISGMVIDAARQTTVAPDGSTFTTLAQRDVLFVTTERRASVNQHSVWAIDLLTGNPRWSANHGRIVAPPVLSPRYDDRIYIATRSGDIKALNKSNGAQIWTLRGLPFMNATAVDSTRPQPRIAAVDAFGKIWMARDNGSTADWLWHAELPIGPLATTSVTSPSIRAVGVPVIDGAGRVYVGARNGTIYQLNGDTGHVEASHTVDPDHTAVINEMTLFTSDVGVTSSLLAVSSENHFVKVCIPFAF